MFRLVVAGEKAKYLVSAFETLNSLCNDVNFEITAENGLTCISLDSCKACLISLILTPEFFESFVSHTNTTISVNLKVLCQIIKTAKPENNITLQCSKEQEDKLKVIIDGTENTEEYILKLYQIDCVNVDMRPNQKEYVLNFSTSFFNQSLKKLRNMGKIVEINATADLVRLTTSGDYGSLEIECREGDDLAISSSSEMDEAEGGFALEFLLKISKGSTCSPRVTVVKLSDQRPIQILYEFDYGFLCFHLSPQVDPET